MMLYDLELTGEPYLAQTCCVGQEAAQASVPVHVKEETL